MNTKNIFLLCLWLFTTCLLQAQDKMPQAISYQAIARDVQGKVVSEKSIGVKVEILRGSENGNVVFSETHKPTSSRTGTVNLLIGQGVNENGSFASIDWGADTYFLQLSMDLAGGDNYQKVSTTQMLPVPYALYAAKAGKVENGGNSGSTEKVSKFTLISVRDDINDDLYSILAGSLDRDEYSSYGDIDMKFRILYLDGQDQELMVSLDGLQDYKIEVGPSTCVGRIYKLYCDNVPDGDYKLVVSDKNGNVVKEYPFTYKAKKL